MSGVEVIYWIVLGVMSIGFTSVWVIVWAMERRRKRSKLQSIAHQVSGPYRRGRR